jgi:hypothetical protein
LMPPFIGQVVKFVLFLIIPERGHSLQSSDFVSVGGKFLCCSHSEITCFLLELLSTLFTVTDWYLALSVIIILPIPK